MRNRRFPKYPDDTDYTTNSPSYYDDLARKQKLIKLLSEKIWEYDDELAKRFEAWDKNLEEFDEEVLKLLLKWFEDGEFHTILDNVLLFDKVGIVENVEELRNKNYIAGQTVLTKGYYTAFDGGDGKYIITEDASLIEDGGSVIDLNNGNKAVLMVTNRINVKQFGAKGDYDYDTDQGTDDTIPFENAIAYLKSRIVQYQTMEGVHKHLWAKPIILELTNDNYYLKNGVTIDGGFAVTIDGYKATIFSDENKPKFTFTGNMASVATFNDIYFQGSGIGVLYDTANNDQSMVQFNRCKWLMNDVGVQYNNRSSIVTFNDCQFYHCGMIFHNIRGDEAVFNRCWFSDIIHTTNYATSFILEWGTNIFNECFFIPHGAYDTNLTTHWNSLSGLAWFDMLEDSKLILDKSRASSEPGFKNIVNYRGNWTMTDPSKSAIILKNTNNLVGRDALIVLTTMPNRINIENINNTVASCKFIRLNDSEDNGYKFIESDFWDYMNSTNGRSKSANVITIKGNTTQFENQYELPEILHDFTDCDKTLFKNFNTGKAEIYLGTYATSTEIASRKTILVKASINSSSDLWNKSVIIGILTIAINRNRFYKLTFSPIMKEFTNVFEEDQGELQFVFKQSGTDELDMRLSGLTDLTVECSYNGLINDSPDPYNINQISYTDLVL